MYEENKAVVRRVIEEFMNRRNFDVADELFAPDFFSHSFPQHTRSEDVKEWMQKWLVAFQDAHFTIGGMIAEEDKVLVRWTARSTTTCESQDTVETGKEAALEGISTWRVAGGKVVEHWPSSDSLIMVQQFGSIPI
jgi:predicted ester cyclase